MINKIRNLLALYIPRFSLRDFLLLTIGALISAVNVDLFLAPVNIAPGGVSGAAIILNKFTNWPIGLVILVLNIPLLALGFRNLGRFRFLVRTAYVVILFSLGTDLLVRWLPPGGLTDDLILNALFGGIVGGIGSGLIYLGQGTSGGTGIIGRLIQQKTGIPLSQVYLFTDGGIVFVAGLVFGWELALYALITLFIWGMAADQILEGPSVVRTALIVTDQPENVSRAVFEHLTLGITAWPARGMFTDAKHTVLFCTINRPEVNALRSLVLDVDPNAFIVIGHGHQAVGGMVGRKAPPMADAIQASHLEKIISNHYDLGKLVDFEQLFLGYCNISYIIMIERNGKKKRFFLRRYRQGITEETIAFEHSVINHLTKKNFHLIAGIIPTRDGKTFVQQIEDGENIFYTIFDFLTGEDRYTWVNPRCSDEDMKGAAVVLARFHNAASDLIPEGRKHEAKINDLIPETASLVERCAQKAGTTVFDTYLLENTHLIQETIQYIQSITEDDVYKQLPQQVIHCDYHPGNLKFQNENITGLFDFDWSKVDVRCFDVALAMFYFCISWEEDQDGNAQLDKITLFLNSYQNELRSAVGVGPLSGVELKFLPYLISAANIYVLNWTIRDFYSAEVDPNEYLVYLQHHIRFMKWLEIMENMGQLVRATAL